MKEGLELELGRAGFLRSGDGCLLTGVAERLYVAWQRSLQELFAEFADCASIAPAFIEEHVLRESGYLEHFPHLVFSSLNPLHPNRPACPLTPAACLHVYPALRGRTLGDGGRVAVIRARCARYEDARWEFPFRSPSFEMVELVAVGNAQRIDSLHERAVARVRGWLASVELPVTLEAATDSFYLGDDDGARVLQRLRGLKKEFVVPAGGEEVAVGSINRHETYFGERFAIRADDSTWASSFCIAFGLERLVACGLLTWGHEPSGWPVAVSRHANLP